MGEKIISKIFIYVAILLIGYVGKRVGVFKKEHTKFLNTIICYITLPAAIINGFQNVTLTPILFVGLAIGLFSNILLLFLGQLITKKRSPQERIVFVFSANCFNIGSFAIPFLTGLISADGFAAICVFDISVALMCFGVNVAVANSISGNNGKIDIKQVIKKICTSPVFITYITLILLTLLKVKIPTIVFELTEVAGGANAFLAMLCIGILFQFKLSKEKWKLVGILLTLRITVLIGISLLVYFLIPLPEDIKLALCVILMAPCPGAAPALTESNGGDGSISAVINSISIPISMGLMSLFLLIL